MNPMHALEKRLEQTGDIHGEQSYPGTQMKQKHK